MAHAPRSAVGVRSVAAFEAAKGVLVLAVGWGLHSLAHHDAQAVVEEIVQRLHLNLARDHPRILIDAATHLDDARLRWLASAALLYSSIRFIEAYGLWRLRTWAEWFAIVSGCVYLPIEVYELVRGPTLVKATVFTANALLVAYLLSVRWRGAARAARAVDIL